MTETVCRQGLELSDFELLLWNWKLISVGHGPQFVTNSNTPNCFMLGWIHTFIIVFEFMEPWPTCQASLSFGLSKSIEAKNHSLHVPYSPLTIRSPLICTPFCHSHLQNSSLLSLSAVFAPLLQCNTYLPHITILCIYTYYSLLPYLCRDLDNAISSWNAK